MQFQLFRLFLINSYPWGWQSEYVNRCMTTQTPKEHWESLMAQWLDHSPQWHEMYCHDLEVMSSNPGQVKLGADSTSFLSCTWTKIYMQFQVLVAWYQFWWFAKQSKEYGHTWHWMSLLRPGVIKEHKLKWTTASHCLAYNSPVYKTVYSRSNCQGSKAADTSLLC